MISRPVANGYYPVYTDVPRGHVGYCAWHSYGTVNGVPVQFAFFYSLDGDPGCDPRGDATRTWPSIPGSARYSAEYRSRTGNLRRPSIVVVSVVSPIAVSIAC